MVKVNLKQFDSLTDQSTHSHKKAKEIMDNSPPFIKKEYSIRSAIEILRINKTSLVSIVNDHHILQGIVTEHDLLLQAASQDTNSSINFKKDIITVDENDELKDILILMLKNKLKIVPVTNVYKRLLGTISRIDLLNELISS